MDISVIKIGGNVIDYPENLSVFLKNFAELPGYKILVHGGGKLATKLAAQLNIPTKMVDGRRITDHETIKIVTMVYAGLINKTITAQLQALNCNSIGLSGADAGLIKAVKRNPVPTDFGFVGDVPAEGVNYTQLLKIINGGMVPVFCSITADKYGTLLNCNADTIAQSLAVAMALGGNAVKLIYCFEKKGLLANINDENSVIPFINSENAEKLKSKGIIAEGMIPKVENAFKALNAGVKEVVIKYYTDLNNNNNGTTIKLD